MGDIEKDVYDSVEADLRAELVSAEGELKRASVSLSNLAEYIDDAIAIACNLGAYWDRRDFEVCQKIQNLVFPEGVIWDKENRCYRTQNCNQFFSLTRSISADFKVKEKDRSCDLSCLVGCAIKIPNRFVRDYKQIILFVEWLGCPTHRSPPLKIGDLGGM